MPRISIIVPVYNVEQFLRRCMDNILAQTFQDFEVVLVNDGSTDDSGKICREYAEKDPRIVIIEKKNGGLSSARNAGLDAAKGEYIGFVDSDDYIAPDMYEFLYKNLVKYKADISICSFYFAYGDGRTRHTKPEGICRCMGKEEAIKTLLSTKQFENYVWDKLYKKTLFDEIRFPENELFEDIAIMYKLLDSSKTVIYESKPKYYYVQRAGSIVNSGFNIKKLQFVEQCRKIVDFSKSRGGLYDRESQTYLAVCSLWLIYEAGICKNKYPQILDKLKADVLNYYSVAMQSRSVRKSEKFALYLLKCGVSIKFICRLHLISKKLYTGLQGYLYKIKNLSEIWKWREFSMRKATLYGSIIITYRCNAKCNMCDCFRDPSEPEEELGLDIIRKLPEMSFVNITGGEPFIRKDINEIVGELYKKTKRIVISTNGYFTDRILQLCREYPNIGIRISIEGLEKANDEIRGIPEGFKRGYGTLKKLVAEGHRDVGFGCTVQEMNAEDLLPLYDLSDELGMEFATATLHNSFYFRKTDNKIEDKFKVVKAFEDLINKMLKSSSPKKWFRAYFNHGLINYIYGNMRYLPCNMGSNGFFVDPFGDVLPCNGSAEKMSMGNLQEKEWDEIWNSPKAEEVRNMVKRCPKNCWMIGSAAPAMKQKIWIPALWVLKHKLAGGYSLKENAFLDLDEDRSKEEYAKKSYTA